MFFFNSLEHFRYNDRQVLLIPAEVLLVSFMQKVDMPNIKQVWNCWPLHSVWYGDCIQHVFVEEQHVLQVFCNYMFKYAYQAIFKYALFAHFLKW